MEEIEKNFDELERNLSKTKKSYENDDVEYREIKDIKDLFDLSIGEDYYQPIVTKGYKGDNEICSIKQGGNNTFLATCLVVRAVV